MGRSRTATAEGGDSFSAITNPDLKPQYAGPRVGDLCHSGALALSLQTPFPSASKPSQSGLPFKAMVQRIPNFNPCVMFSS